MTEKNADSQPEPKKHSEQMELSDTWRELLGQRLDAYMHRQSDDEVTSEKGDRGQNASEKKDEDPDAIPTLKSDPWSMLLKAKGIEVVDLNKANLQISDQDVERILKLMHEYQDQDGGDSSPRS